VQICQYTERRYIGNFGAKQLILSSAEMDFAVQSHFFADLLLQNSAIYLH
jgi:hypothetical protein